MLPIQYRPFRIKNAPIIFSQIVVVAFKEFINKFLEVYLVDWNVFIILKKHFDVLCLMLDRWKYLQISLNLKKCIFFVPFGILLGHIVCKQGLLVDLTNISLIVHLPFPTLVWQLRSTLGYRSYYQNCIQGYAKITTFMENLLKKSTYF